jgi:drug/metabolite transporter (DMT)-like permease
MSLVVLFSSWFLGEPPTRREIAGVILERGVDASMQSLFGNVILSVAVFASGL